VSGLNLPTSSVIYPQSSGGSKTRLQAAYDVSDQRFVVTYQNAFTQDDQDIWALIVDNRGNQVSHTFVNFDSTVDMQPSVTWVNTTGGANHFLVSYIETGTGAGTALKTNWVDPAGNVSASTTIVPASAGQSVIFPVTSFATASTAQKILMAWGTLSSGADAVAITFLDPSTLAAGAVSKFGSGANAAVLPSVAYNSFNDNFAVGWREALSGGSSPSLKIRAFAPHCRSISCAYSIRTAVSDPKITEISRLTKIVPSDHGFAQVFACYEFGGSHRGLCGTLSSFAGVPDNTDHTYGITFLLDGCGGVQMLDAAGPSGPETLDVHTVHHPSCFTQSGVSNVTYVNWKRDLNNVQTLSHMKVSDQ
jgi:hypothetical protein